MHGMEGVARRRGAVVGIPVYLGQREAIDDLRECGLGNVARDDVGYRPDEDLAVGIAEAVHGGRLALSAGRARHDSFR